MTQKIPTRFFLDMVPIHLRNAGQHERLAWAEGKCFCVPGELAGPLRRQGALDARGNLTIPAELPEEVDQEIADVVLLAAAFTENPPLSSRLPFSYQRVPPRLRALAATCLGRLHAHRQAQWAKFPGWPLDLSADFVADLLNVRPGSRTGRTPVILTHDLDSPEGVRNILKYFLQLEEKRGARSVNFMVPHGRPLDHGALGEITARGHSLGIHGHDHSNLTPFASPEQKHRRLVDARETIRQYGILGYRAPSLLRTKALLSALAEWYRYDSSIPTSGGLFPVPNNGCASARPFFLDGLAEIPLSLPRDGSLRFLGHSPGRIAAMLIDCSEQISASGGVVMALTHGEERFSGNPAMLNAYELFLDHIACSDRFVFSTPEEILSAPMRRVDDAWLDVSQKNNY